MLAVAFVLAPVVVGGLVFVLGMMGFPVFLIILALYFWAVPSEHRL